MKGRMNATRIRIPTEAECGRLMAEMGMLENIVAHCRQVCRVSLLIVDHLNPDGLNRELVWAAALLHDITKTRSFQTHEDHAETGAQLLVELGYPEARVSSNSRSSSRLTALSSAMRILVMTALRILPACVPEQPCQLRR